MSQYSILCQELMKQDMQNGMKFVNVNVDQASVCSNKQHRNNNKCRNEFKELFDKEMRDKEFTWNPSNCERECDKSCDIGEYQLIY